MKCLSHGAFNSPNMACNYILQRIKVIIAFIYYISLTPIGVVIFLQPFHAGFIFLWFSSRFLWKMEPVCSVYTAGWKTRPPDCKYKHGAGFFRPVHSHSYLRRAIKVSILPKTRHFFSFILLLFVLHWSCALVLWRLGEGSLHGLFLWHSKSGAYPNVKVIYLAVHPFLGFCVLRKRGTGPYCISWPIVSNEYPDKQVGALMWAPHGPDLPNLRLPGPFFNKALMLVVQPQCSVSLIVKWEPSGMLMNIQWGFVSRTVLPLSASPSLSSPLKLQGRFTGLLLEGGHLAHCDANSLKFDV